MEIQFERVLHVASVEGLSNFEVLEESGGSRFSFEGVGFNPLRQFLRR